MHTDSGLRLAALVPAQNKATLIDPVTSLTQDVALPAPYQSLSVVTNALGSASGCDGGTTSPGVPTDVALLWNGTTVAGQAGVAFWELGQAGCQPYRSIDTVGVTEVVAQVLDVPTPNATLKVLQTRGGDAFYILNLSNRTAAPLRDLQLQRRAQRLAARRSGLDLRPLRAHRLRHRLRARAPEVAADRATGLGRVRDRPPRGPLARGRRAA